MAISSEDIKYKVKELGFQKVGIAPVEEIMKEKSYLEKWLHDMKNATMHWMIKRKEERGDIRNYYPDAVSVISVGMNYFNGHNQEDLKSDYKFSNYAWGDDYHSIIKKKLFQLLNWMKENMPDLEGIVCVDTSPVMEKVWANKAGIGWLGKHTNLISRDYGSWLFLGEIIVNKSLEYDLPFNDDLCGSCTACIEACPTQALVDYQIDAGKCISYITIEKRGEFINDNSIDLHGWIYGCDICQEVCPWNITFSNISSSPEFQPREEILNFTNNDWESLNITDYRKIFKGSAAKRAKFSGLKRNIDENKKIKD